MNAGERQRFGRSSLPWKAIEAIVALRKGGSILVISPKGDGAESAIAIPSGQRRDRRALVPAIMHRKRGGVAHGDEQDRNHAAATPPNGRAVERNGRSECRSGS
jgi:hypothetical protein